MLKRSKCELCGKTAKENGDHLNKILVKGLRTILCNGCLKVHKESEQHSLPKANETTG